MAQYTHSEQAQPKGEIRFCLSNGDYKTCTEEELIDWIEANGFNRDVTFSHNTSPSGQDPQYDVYQEIWKDPQTLLDDNWNDLTERYYDFKWGVK